MENMEADFSKARRRPIDVTFPSGTIFKTYEKGKITCGANCTYKPGDMA